MNHSTPGLLAHHQTPGVHTTSCPWSRWCIPTNSSSVVPFSYCPQSFRPSGSFQMSQLFASGWEQGSTAVVQGWSEWPPGIKVHAAGRYRKRLLFVLAPLAHHERQIPKAWFCLSAFLILPTQHFFRVCRETGVGFHNQISPVTQNSQPGWVCFLYHISELLCSPLPGLFPFPL